MFKSEPELDTIEEFAIVKCNSNSDYIDLFEDESLYCLEDYNSYAIEGTRYDDVFRELQISFESCKG